jgi:hypothetical protein
MPLGDTPLGDTPLGDTPLGDTPLGDISLGDTSLSDIPIGDTLLLAGNCRLNDGLLSDDFLESRVGDILLLFGKWRLGLGLSSENFSGLLSCDLSELRVVDTCLPDDKSRFGSLRGNILFYKGKKIFLVNYFVIQHNQKNCPLF